MGCFHSKQTEETQNNNSNSDNDENTPKMECRICYNKIPQPLQATVSRPCKKHRSPTCDDCIRTMFLNACKDESQMPPACCNPISTRYARRVLSPDEMALFEEKYEEWSTPDRLYCPVPTCSAFIPPRLFPKTGKKPLLQGAKQQQAVSPAGVQTPPPTPPDEEASTTVSCPQCSVRICLSCKRLSHPGDPCPEGSDIPPELQALLKILGIKRCPRCHAAVRRLYGCPHIKCRCGAQWCWWCTGPIQICQVKECPLELRGLDEEEEMNFAADQYFQATNNADQHEGTIAQQETDRIINLDAGSNWDEQGLDLGREPIANEVHPFTCQHMWDESYSALHDYAGKNQEEECARCWRPLIPCPEEYFYLGLGEFLDTGAIKETPADDFPRTEDFANLCRRCGTVLCTECRELDQSQQ
ncbi:hypothetical protein PISL3812_02872 [Talaromyces islandicus]|uniref:RBR-type E3 ubiquitin transferase n=1 Tax=Talaromyces islandicus TaxID=28573 RepID=A0A0U1LR41_TALIS|nr:hypothetical protein PISL3812_02872 [Talaromyces islandicus]